MQLNILFCFLASVAISAASAASLPEQCRQIIQSKGKTNEAVRLHQLFDAHWSDTMEQFPETATANGYPGRHRTWTDYSAEAIHRRKSDLLPLLDAAKSFDPAQLQEIDSTSLKLFRRNV